MSPIKNPHDPCVCPLCGKEPWGRHCEGKPPGACDWLVCAYCRVKYTSDGMRHSQLLPGQLPGKDT